MNQIVIRYCNGMKKTYLNPVQPYYPQWQNTQAPVRDTHIVWQETPITKIPTNYYQLEYGTTIKEGDIVRCNETGLFKPVEKSFYGLKVSGMRDTFRPVNNCTLRVEDITWLLETAIVRAIDLRKSDVHLKELEVLRDLAPTIAEEFVVRINKKLSK